MRALSAILAATTLGACIDFRDGLHCQTDADCHGYYCHGGQCSIEKCIRSCGGRYCGSDGCGGSCGNCSGGSTCSPTGACCTTNCNGKQCGDDGCGGSCGVCPASLTCGSSDGLCRVPALVTESGSISSFVADGTHLYWANGSISNLGVLTYQVRQSAKDGSEISTIAQVSPKVQGDAISIASDGATLFFAIGSLGVYQSAAPNDARLLYQFPPSESYGNFIGLILDQKSVYALGHSGNWYVVPRTGGSGSLLANAGSSGIIDSVAASGGSIYWTTYNQGITKMDKSNGSYKPIVSDAATGMSADASNIYWLSGASGGNNLAFMSIDGTTPTVLPIGQGIHCLASDGVAFYYCGFDEGRQRQAIMKLPLLGGTPEPVSGIESVAPGNVVVDGTHIYWTDGFPAGQFTIRRRTK